MKLVFGKGKVSREDIEREAAREIEALIASGEDPPAIDWSVYGLSPDVADPAIASADLANGASESDAATTTKAPAPRARSTKPAARAKAPARNSKAKAATATKPKPKPKTRAKATTAPARKPRAPRKSTT